MRIRGVFGPVGNFAGVLGVVDAGVNLVFLCTIVSEPNTGFGRHGRTGMFMVLRCVELRPASKELSWTAEMLTFGIVGRHCMS